MKWVFKTQELRLAGLWGSLIYRISILSQALVFDQRMFTIHMNIQTVYLCRYFSLSIVYLIFILLTLSVSEGYSRNGKSVLK